MLSSPLLHHPSSYFFYLHRIQQLKLLPRTREFPFHSLNSSPLVGCHKDVLAPFVSKSSLSSSSSSSASASASLVGDDFEVELGRLLALLPEEMRRRVGEHPDLHHLIEVVMDLGRKPLARFPSGDFVLSDHPITMQDLEHATSQVIMIIEPEPVCSLNSR